MNHKNCLFFVKVFRMFKNLSQSARSYLFLWPAECFTLMFFLMFKRLNKVIIGRDPFSGKSPSANNDTNRVTPHFDVFLMSKRCHKLVILFKTTSRKNATNQKTLFLVFYCSQGWLLVIALQTTATFALASLEKFC